MSQTSVRRSGTKLCYKSLRCKHHYSRRNRIPLIIVSRIERYTKPAQSALVSDNLPESASLVSRSSTIHPGSPTASRFTETSASHLENGQPFTEVSMPYHPAPSAQTARMNPSQSANDPTTSAQRKSSSAGLAKSQSMMFSPPGGLSGQAPPQPPMMQASTFPTQTSPSVPRTDSIGNMVGSEPRMFPGVVMNRHRRSSLVRPETSDGMGSGMSWGRRSEVGEAVVEEGSKEVSPNKTPTGED